jgi:hypothetical protein
MNWDPENFRSGELKRLTLLERLKLIGVWFNGHDLILTFQRNWKSTRPHSEFLCVHEYMPVRNPPTIRFALASTREDAENIIVNFALDQEVQVPPQGKTTKLLDIQESIPDAILLQHFIEITPEIREYFNGS